MWFDSFTDLQFTKEKVLVDADTVAIVFRFQETQRGKFFGVPTAGHHLSVRNSTHQFESVLVAHEQQICDFSDVLARSGVMKISPVL